MNFENIKLEVQDDIARLTLASIADSALHGELFAQQILREAGEWIGNTLSGAANLFDPEKVILAGILAQEDRYPMLVQGLRSSYESGLVHTRSSIVPLVASHFQLDSALLGGAAVVFERLLPAYPVQYLAQPAVDQPS